MRAIEPERAAMRLVAVAVLCFLQACATDPHDLGMKQIKDGAFSAGLSNLRAASIQSPGNSLFRSDYLRERDKLTNQLLLEAASFRSQGDLESAETSYRSILEHDSELSLIHI